MTIPPIWAWISVERDCDDTRLIPFNERVCAALVGLPNEELTQLMLYDLFLFSHRAEQVAKELVALQIKAAYIDVENYDWLIERWNSNVNEVFLTRADRRGEIPALYPYQRDSDPLLRQVDVMENLDQEHPPGLLIAEHLINNPAQVNQIKQWGKSIIADAVAGAVMIAKAESANLRALQEWQVYLDNQPDIWMGMERLKYR